MKYFEITEGVREREREIWALKHHDLGNPKG